jgi:hypothetical protein
VHYIATDGQLKHNVLGVRELEGDHSGENQAVVIAVILDFQIVTKLGFLLGIMMVESTPCVPRF